jgi:hypothetical protein
MNSCLLIGCFGLFSGGQDEVGEVLEHPVVFEGVVDDSQEFVRQGDIGLASGEADLQRRRRPAWTAVLGFSWAVVQTCADHVGALG